MATYKCKQCGYQTKKDRVPEMCNYCGKKNSMSEIKNASDLIKEV